MTDTPQNTPSYIHSFHNLQARVYVADTDFSGIVYHARYLEFFERGRSEFLRTIGLDNIGLASNSQSEKLFFVVRRMNINFSRPAQLDDLLTIKTRISHIQGARLFMAQSIMRDEILLVEANVEIAIINQEGKPRRIPQDLFPPQKST
ncbi:tol-pal system-associated acyl-CoA thioesterase [Bartonella ancashensis]|uniref:4-hydroxybenzoyl-CoA thioesterase family active site n=1 Tax=Bartonella ancashensis TaxID=1318743 RepID=A0A0M5KSE4_9HYPH|nr:tol-pal system-associated acyl-CoA thioesterase [Bartonella ancashensis]ALE03128.1 4-hydroxybenzoyl-CoA thioesterase family active site [Bartonella ancashensis]